MLFTFGVVMVFGAAIALCRHLFVKLMGYSGLIILLVTGAVGIPVHELSHAAMCILFGHRIEEMALYRPNLSGEMPGYVYHAYNKRNLYHQIGNVFIGIAPILCGSGVLLLLMRWLVPDIFGTVMGIFHEMRLLDANWTSAETYMAYGNALKDMVLAIFSPDYLSSVRFWVYVVLAVSISCHMELSLSDIRAAAKGMAYLSVLVLAFDAILFVVSRKTLATVTATMLAFSSTIIGFLTISLVFSLAFLAFAFAWRVLHKILLRR